MADKPHITRDGYVERLVQVGVWATPQNPIQYAFLEQRPAYLPDEPGWTVLSGAQRAAVEKAFAMIAEVVNLTFVQVPDNQQQPGPDNPRINFYANTVELSYSGSMDAYQFDGSSAIQGADIRFNTSRIAQRQSNEGWQDFTSFVALHEVLHSMGLSHPGDYNGQGFNYQDDADFFEDTIQYSVMSYFGAANTGADHFIGSVLYGGRTPLLYDILALQSLYSPNMTTRAGDTVYGFNSNTGATSPFNFAVTTGPVVAIWDAGGTDTIDLSGYASASLIDLNEGAFSDAGGLTKNIAVAYNVTIENAVGGTGADRLIGNAVANRLDGGAGADTMEGGSGDDVYIVDDSGDGVVELAGAGRDEVRTALAAYVLPANVELLTGTSSAGQSLTGNNLANSIAGGSGADQLAGGLGDDLYTIDTSDTIVEAANAGIDEARTALAAYTLEANVENLTGTSSAGQSLTGNTLANLLAGGAGADHFAGGLGNDVYIVGLGDVVTEAANAGIDEARTALAAYTLGANLERLTGTSAAGQTLTGNGLANLISGGAGNDFIAGGSGADQLAGGLGNDLYTMDTSDTIVEAANAGTDEVRTAIAAYTLGANVENLTGTSSAGQSLTGNDLANRLAGGAGADQFAGGLGNDVYLAGAGDVVTEAANAGTDEVQTALAAYTLDANVERLTGTSGAGQTLTGNGLSNLITGGAGNDVIAGGSGADMLAGGLGNDVYTMDTSDTIVEAANAGIDEVRTAIAAYTLGANVENLTGTSSAGQSLTGNGLANRLTGGGGNDVLDGGAGNDSLAGGNGADLLVGGTGADSLKGGAGADVFRYDAAGDSTAGATDLIGDFQVGVDKIDLHLIDANTLAAGDQAFHWIGANAFSATGAAAAGELRVYQSGAYWWAAGDTNGDGTADLVIALTPQGAILPAQGDFLL
jgi:serralysin